MLQRRRERQKAEQIHEQRTRRAHGCVGCGKRISPEIPRVLCARCPEEYALCFRRSCKGDKGKIARVHLEKHPDHWFVHEMLHWEVDPAPIESATSPREALLVALQVYGPRPLLGCRKEGGYVWVSYAEVKKEMERIGTAMYELGVRPKDVVVIMGAPSAFGYVPIPIGHVKGMNVGPLMKKAECSWMIVSSHLSFEVALVVKELDVCHVVWMDDPFGPYELQAKHEKEELPAHVHSYSFTALTAAKETRESYPVGEDPVMLLPTSGSTGVSKLVVVTADMLLHQAHPPQHGSLLVMFSHQPLRQSLDVLAKGGCIGMSSGPPMRWEQDCQALRPTVVGATPSFWNHLYQSFLEDVEQGEKEQVIEKWKERQVLGNRCSLAVVGGASTSEVIKKWIFNVLGAVVVDGYGTTETGGLAGNGQVHNTTKMQLLDCPSMGYFTSDTPPRGEIVVQTSRMTPGYYGDPEATAQAFVEIAGQKWFRTGDIGTLEDGQVRVIDRKKSFFKLAQGVYVSPSTLEKLYSRHAWIHQILIWGTPDLFRVVAVVVPSPVALQRPHLEHDLVQACAELGKYLPSWERPGHFLIEPVLFSVENGLLNAAGKLVRPALLQRYRAPLEALLGVRMHDVVPSDDPVALNPQGLCAGLLHALTVAFGERSYAPADTLAAVGGDSMALALLSKELHRHFGVRLPLPELVRCSTLMHLQVALFGGGCVSTPTLARDWKKEVDRCWKTEWPEPVAAPQRAFLVTGATGFVGAYIVDALLACEFPVVVLIRGKDVADATCRFVKNMRRYQLHYQGARIVCGTLHHLLNCIDMEACCVIHCAAEVNSALPYDQLFMSNVQGAVECIAFAHRYGIPLHHVSTVGLLAGSGVCDEEQNVPPVALNVLSGYAQSKWVAEALVFRALDTQVVVQGAVHRVGNVSGSSSLGLLNASSAVGHIVRGLVREGCVCLEDDGPLPVSFPLVPVDYVASGIMHVATRTCVSRSIPAPFSLYHWIAKRTVTLEEIVKVVDTKIELKRVTAGVFREKMNDLEQDHPLFCFGSVLSGGGYVKGGESMAPKDDRTRGWWMDVHKEQVCCSSEYGEGALRKMVDCLLGE